MTAFLLMPLVSFAANGLESWEVMLSQLWTRTLEWGVPYLVGRLYLADFLEQISAVRAVVVAGLMYVPLVLFETVVGPKWYLLPRLYGVAPHMHMVERLGGWRPEVFMTNGIELSSLLALITVLATWLWAIGVGRFGKIPGWIPPLVLLFGTIMTRCVYGYALVLLGLMSVGLARLMRLPLLVLVPLALVPPAYTAVRVTHAWDVGAAVNAVSALGREGSLAYRFRAEDQYMEKVAEHNLALGFGGRNSSIYDFFAQRHLWPDGWWVHVLRETGVVEPVVMSSIRPSGEPDSLRAAKVPEALALWATLHLIDSLQNMALLTITPWFAGALVARIAGRWKRPSGDQEATGHLRVRLAR
jgi:hypothetical protein